MMRRRAFYPALLIALIVGAQMAAVQVWRLSRRMDVVYVKKYFFGLDYYDFYQASQRLRGGESPYGVERYVTPPVPALLNVPLSLLSFRQASTLVAILIPVALMLSYGLVHARYFPLRDADGMRVLLLSVAVVLLSYPFYFLFERGNIDAFVLAGMCLGIVLAGRHGVVAGACLAVAIGMKVYPVLALVPLIIHRRLKAVVATGACLLLLVAVAPTLWAEFGSRLSRRAEAFSLDENASILCTFRHIGLALGSVGLPFQGWLWSALALMAYAAMLGLGGYADYVKSRRRDAAGELAATVMYFPFMMALPQRAYHYGLVILLPMIPVVCHLWKRHEDSRTRKILLLMALGIALSQWQAVALAQLVGNLVPHCIPGVGLLAVMVGCTWYKVRR
jgi:hypothetical protein